MIRINLKSSIQHEGNNYASIDIGEPTVGGIEVFQNAQIKGESDTSATVKMIAFETGIPEAVIRKIKTSDFVKISEALTPFVAAAAPATGGSGDLSAQT